MAFRAVDISAAAVGNIAVAVDDKHMGNHLNAEGTQKIAVAVEKHFIFPPFGVDKRFHFAYVLGLVGRDGDKLHSGLLLPVGINLVDSLQLAVAGLAPCGEETDYKWLAIVAQSGGVNGFSVDSLEAYRRELGACTGYRQQGYGQGK